MTTEQYFKNLEVPDGPVDVVLDTDTFNEIDDQFALSYMLLTRQKLNVRGVCAAPFSHRILKRIKCWRTVSSILWSVISIRGGSSLIRPTANAVRHSFHWRMTIEAW